MKLVNSNSIIIGIAGFVMLVLWITPSSAMQPWDSQVVNSSIANGTVSTLPCSYLISTNGITITAQNCANGHVDFSNTDASTVINQAINSTQNSQLIFINQGDYIINHTSIELQHGTNIWGVSSGQAVTNGKVGTHLQLANNANINLMEYTKNYLGYFIHLNNLFIDGNFAHNTKGNGTFFNANASDVEIENTYIDGFAQNCVVHKNIYNFRAIGSTFEHCQKDGMLIEKGTDGTIMGSKFLVNSQYGLETGTSNGGVAGLRVVDDYFAGNLKFNMVTFNSPDMNIENNFYQETSNNPPSTGDHLDIENNCSNTLVSNNVFVASGHTRSAIRVTHASCSSSQITNNNIVGSYASTLVVDSGTSTMLRGNTGFITENSGTATITALATSVAVTHGLSYTPSLNDITITPQGNDFSCGSWWISNPTSTQFTINCNTAPTTGALSFSWKVQKN